MNQKFSFLATCASSQLRFLTCGSVDDGKSTLIGRLLYDAKLILDDQLVDLKRDSVRYGAADEEIEFSLLVDGLEAEREQGITIDVAYRFFQTRRRSFIVADTPGHEQYTRNMASGASTAELAVLLIDARKGLLPQTRRHATICSLLGIRHIVAAVNKIDLVGFDRQTYDRIDVALREFTAELDFATIASIPISARYGDNVTARSERTPWYQGMPLAEYLERIDTACRRSFNPLRFPVQWINRCGQEQRRLAGTLTSGTMRRGDAVVIHPSGQRTTIAQISAQDGACETAHAGDAVTLQLSDDVDVARGDMVASQMEPPYVSDRFAADLIWMAEEPLLFGRSYFMRIGTKSTLATVTAIHHKLDMAKREKVDAKTLSLNEIGSVGLWSSTPVAFDSYRDNRLTGSLILIDRSTNQTVAAGMIHSALDANVRRVSFSVDKMARARIKHQRGAIVWFTGLSGSGKSTIANLVESRLNEIGVHTMLLDGDNVRNGLNKDLGFTSGDRVENIRRVGEVARLFVEAGIIVLCAFISPFSAERQFVRELVEPGEYLEAFVDAPIEDCIARDTKGLYEKALAGHLQEFTGVSSPYQRPENSEIVIPTRTMSAFDAATEVIEMLKARRIVG
ncbi:adenylyl-sulfate kinase [Bradyrhizobium sp. BR 10261]|uniref:adenylyl-sulfate kinase n=1 Tax=Bradyrhizobium sp. BR 10261 TaxID=2749992 RepID=UPI001C652599|nr:adenylyl-sulfate kinase [Bradyrhizobium sp. BR 10261]MBW7967146.1 adenylyl-sulfate kinase [Bradyrhizobium sp. BR 10261]